MLNSTNNLNNTSSNSSNPSEDSAIASEVSSISSRESFYSEAPSQSSTDSFYSAISSNDPLPKLIKVVPRCLADLLIWLKAEPLKEAIGKNKLPHEIEGLTPTEKNELQKPNKNVLINQNFPFDLGPQYDYKLSPVTQNLLNKKLENIIKKRHHHYNALIEAVQNNEDITSSNLPNPIFNVLSWLQGKDLETNADVLSLRASEEETKSILKQLYSLQIHAFQEIHAQVQLEQQMPGIFPSEVQTLIKQEYTIFAKIYSLQKKRANVTVTHNLDNNSINYFKLWIEQKNNSALLSLTPKSIAEKSSLLIDAINQENLNITKLLHTTILDNRMKTLLDIDHYIQTNRFPNTLLDVVTPDEEYITVDGPFEEIITDQLINSFRERLEETNRIEETKDLIEDIKDTLQNKFTQLKEKIEKLHTVHDPDIKTNLHEILGNQLNQLSYIEVKFATSSSVLSSRTYLLNWVENITEKLDKAIDATKKLQDIEATYYGEKNGYIISLADERAIIQEVVSEGENRLNQGVNSPIPRVFSLPKFFYEQIDKVQSLVQAIAEDRFSISETNLEAQINAQRALGELAIKLTEEVMQKAYNTLITNEVNEEQKFQKQTQQAQECVNLIYNAAVNFPIYVTELEGAEGEVRFTNYHNILQKLRISGCPKVQLNFGDKAVYDIKGVQQWIKLTQENPKYRSSAEIADFFYSVASKMSVGKYAEMTQAALNQKILELQDKKLEKVNTIDIPIVTGAKAGYAKMTPREVNQKANTIGIPTVTKAEAVCALLEELVTGSIKMKKNEVTGESKEKGYFKKAIDYAQEILTKIKNLIKSCYNAFTEYFNIPDLEENIKTKTALADNVEDKTVESIEIVKTEVEVEQKTKDITETHTYSVPLQRILVEGEDRREQQTNTSIFDRGQSPLKRSQSLILGSTEGREGTEQTDPSISNQGQVPLRCAQSLKELITADNQCTSKNNSHVEDLKHSHPSSYKVK